MSGVSIRTAQRLLSPAGCRNAVTFIPRSSKNSARFGELNQCSTSLTSCVPNHLHGDGPFPRLGPHRPVGTVRRYASGFVDALRHLYRRSSVTCAVPKVRALATIGTHSPKKAEGSDEGLAQEGVATTDDPTGAYAAGLVPVWALNNP